MKKTGFIVIIFVILSIGSKAQSDSSSTEFFVAIKVGYLQQHFGLLIDSYELLHGINFMMDYGIIKDNVGFIGTLYGRKNFQEDYKDQSINLVVSIDAIDYKSVGCLNGIQFKSDSLYKFLSAFYLKGQIGFANIYSPAVTIEVDRFDLTFSPPAQNKVTYDAQNTLVFSSLIGVGTELGYKTKMQLGMDLIWEYGKFLTNETTYASLITERSILVNWNMFLFNFSLAIPLYW